MHCIIGSSMVYGTHPAKVLETMGGRLKKFDQLPEIRADLIGLDDDWQRWGLPSVTLLPMKTRSLIHEIVIFQTSCVSGSRHQGQECRSKYARQCCGNRHHASICERQRSAEQ